MKRRFIFVVILLCIFNFACGGRVPSPKTAQSVAMGYFKKYGKKYPASFFGMKNVSHVTINLIEEISFQHAIADTLVSLVDGHTVRAVVSMEKKFPQGWKVQSWETVGVSE